MRRAGMTCSFGSPRERAGITLVPTVPVGMPSRRSASSGRRKQRTQSVQDCLPTGDPGNQCRLRGTSDAIGAASMNDERTSIDPEDLYPASGFLLVERNALRVLELLPLGRLTRTRDAIQIDDGDEAGISVLITAEAIELRLPTVEWTKARLWSCTASRLWKRIRLATLSDKRLQSLICTARETRRSEFINCRYCKRPVPPEHRHGDVCHGCAELHEGIVIDGSDERCTLFRAEDQPTRRKSLSCRSDDFAELLARTTEPS